MRLDHSEPGEGIVLYFGEKPGSLFVSVGLGFSGYELTPRRTYRFMHPYLNVGRILDPRSFGRSYSRRVRVPAWCWDRFNEWRWRKS